MPASKGVLAVERGAGCWTLTLDRPEKANALSAPLVEALIDAVSAASAAAVPVLVIRGNGRNLSAGFDFGGYESQAEGELLQRFVRIETLLQSLASSPCLTVALAHGRNFGAGVDLFAACRWRIAAPEATFRMPGLGFGLLLGTRRFASIVGREAAREVLEGLATLDAVRALELGLVRRVSAVDDWPEAISQALDTTRAMPAASRALLYRTLDAGRDDADLADLVRSASAPGLKQRIAEYLARQEAGSPRRKGTKSASM